MVQRQAAAALHVASCCDGIIVELTIFLLTCALMELVSGLYIFEECLMAGANVIGLVLASPDLR